jgi:hypothetical protein
LVSPSGPQRSRPDTVVNTAIGRSFREGKPLTVTPDAPPACASPLELEMRRGAIVRVPVGFDAPTLARLLAVLEERA